MLTKVSIAKHTDTAYHVETPFIQAEVGFKNLHTITEKYRYANTVFENGKRSKATQESFTNLLIYDIDNDRDRKLSFIEACLLLNDVKSLIVTTKSHQKPKNGIVEDRYRILFPLDKVIDVHEDEYPQFYLHVAGLLGIEHIIDLACKDVARMYQPYKTQKVYYSDSTNILSYKQLKSLFEETKALNTAMRNIARYEQSHKIETDGSKTDYLRSIIMTEDFLSLMKTDERFVSGNRNNYLFSCGSYLKENDLHADEIKETLMWMNDLYDGIPQKELESLIGGLKL